MNIYVYQIEDGSYRASLSPMDEGRVVETWPVNNDREYRFVASHGSAFGGVTREVVLLADKAKELLEQNGAYTKEQQQDLISQEDLRDRSKILDAKERDLEVFEARVQKSETDVAIDKELLNDELDRLGVFETSLASHDSDLKQKQQYIDSVEVLLDARQLSLDQHEHYINKLEERIIKQHNELAVERDQLMLNIEGRENRLEERELILNRINDQSFIERFKTGLSIIFGKFQEK